MSQPLLSIGMIVKNEERCLEKCLKALEPLRQAIPCELVIADTGSTDRTREIASKYADILFDFEWVNDFSAARNSVMDKATGKWFLAIDADEYLTPNIDELVHFLTTTDTKKIVIASVVIRNHFSISLDGNYSDSHLVRLVRMDSKRRFHGRIHESLSCDNLKEIYTLTNTIFDHDGYASISPEFTLKKEERNLKLLEDELKKEPNNLRTLSQCLDSSSKNQAKRRYFTVYAFEQLQSATNTNPTWATYGPSCIRQALVYAINDYYENTSDLFDYAFKNFFDNISVLFDVNYMYVKHSLKNKMYKNAIKAGKDYLKAFEKRKNTNTIDFFSNLLYDSHSHKQEILCLTASAMIELKREDEAIKYLYEVDLKEQQKNTPINIWLTTTLELKNKKEASKLIKDKLSKIFDGYKNADESFSYTYHNLIPLINNIFSINSENENYKLFADAPESISLQVKIIDSTSTSEIVNCLNKFELNENLTFEEFSPLAFKKVLSSGVFLPEKFYSSSQEELSMLTTEIAKIYSDIQEKILTIYTNPKNLVNFPQITFAFNLLTNVLFTSELTDEQKQITLTQYFSVGELFLYNCYNTSILQNETNISCLPHSHAFAWYLVKANNLKEDSPIEYIKTLKTALQKIPQAKQIVEFLIEEFKNEEEAKRQEQIKTASPELVAMAEQLKTMLKAFPENSPELLAIKRSPMYKQVAFLIED